MWGSNLIGLITKNRFKSIAVFINSQAATEASKIDHFYLKQTKINIYSNNRIWKYRLELNDAVSLREIARNIKPLNPIKIDRESVEELANQNIIIYSNKLLSEHENSLFFDYNNDSFKGRAHIN